jgi:hypothetical protein
LQGFNALRTDKIDIDFCKNTTLHPSRVARFFWVQHSRKGKIYQNGENIPKRGKYTKTGKIYQNGEFTPKRGIYTKTGNLHQNGEYIPKLGKIPNNHKIYQTAVK